MKRKTLHKAVAVAAAAVMAMGTLAGCGSSNTAESTAAAETTESTASSEAAESTEVFHQSIQQMQDLRKTSCVPP